MLNEDWGAGGRGGGCSGDMQGAGYGNPGSDSQVKALQFIQTKFKTMIKARFDTLITFQEILTGSVHKQEPANLSFLLKRFGSK